MSQLGLKTSSRQQEGKEVYEGRVSIPGLQSTKLTRQDGSTTFGTRSAVVQAARKIATQLGLQVEEPQRAAAKVAPKATARSRSRTQKSKKSK